MTQLTKPIFWGLRSLAGSLPQTATNGASSLGSLNWSPLPQFLSNNVTMSPHCDYLSLTNCSLRPMATPGVGCLWQTPVQQTRPIPVCTLGCVAQSLHSDLFRCHPLLRMDCRPEHTCTRWRTSRRHACQWRISGTTDRSQLGRLASAALSEGSSGTNDDTGSKLTYITRSKGPRKVPQYTGTVR
jgi:hypothetical protein